MSQVIRLEMGSGANPPIETLTMDDGSVVAPDGAGNIDVFGSAGANGAINIQTDGTVSGLPASTAGIRLTDSILLPSTNASGTEGVIALGSTSYAANRFMHAYGTDNTFLGLGSGNLTLNVGSAVGNVGIGLASLDALTTGHWNTGCGWGTLSNATSSLSNSALGLSALSNLTTGNGGNIGIGYRSLENLVTGEYTIGIGYQAGNNYTTSESNNIVIGNGGTALDANCIRLGFHGNGTRQQNKCFIAGIRDVNTITNQKAVVISSVTGQLGISDGTAVGQTITGDTGGALSPTAGNWNILGSHGINTSGAGSTLTVAINNAITLGDLSVIAAGSNALSATTGDINVAAGSVKVPTTTDANTGVYYIGSIPSLYNYGVRNYFGGASGNFTTTGNDNNGFGETLRSLTSGGANSAYGQGALDNCQDGAYNCAVGYGASGLLVSGGGNMSMGWALASATSGDHNVAIGFGAIYNKVAPTGIIAIGRDCLGSQPADYSVGMGYQAFYNTNSTAPSTGIGSQVLQNVTSGGYNTALGYQSGISLTGTDSSNIVIVNSGTVGDNNTIRIGTQGSGSQQQNKCYIAGIVGVTTSNSQLVTIDSSTGQLGVTDLQPFPWSVITLDQTASINQGYFCNKGSTLALALPAASSVGDVIEVSNINTALGIQFTQAAGQQIFIGNTSTTLGAAGTLTSSAVGDALKIVCSAANTTWRVVSMVGSWTPA